MTKIRSPIRIGQVPALYRQDRPPPRDAGSLTYGRQGRRPYRSSSRSGRLRHPSRETDHSAWNQTGMWLYFETLHPCQRSSDSFYSPQGRSIVLRQPAQCQNANDVAENADFVVDSIIRFHYSPVNNNVRGC